MTAAVHLYGDASPMPTAIHMQPGQTRSNPLRLVLTRSTPMHRVARYAKLAVRLATVRRLDDQWLATIDGFPGVWACEDSVVEALSVLEHVVVDWALLKLEDGDRDLPRIGGADLNAR